MPATVDYAFLHGGGQGSWVWDETIAALSRQGEGSIRTLALDVPGCGQKRGRQVEDISPDDVARELIADIEQAGMRDVILVGHSLAGNVLPNMASVRPSLFRRLTYLSCSIPLPGQTVLKMMGSGLHGSHPDEVGWPAIGPLAEIFGAMFCNDMDPATTKTFLAKLESDDWPPATYSNTAFAFEGHFGVPATYIFCLQDSSLPLSWQEVFAERFRVGRRVNIDAGHQAMTTQPEKLADILRADAVA